MGLYKMNEEGVSKSYGHPETRKNNDFSMTEIQLLKLPIRYFILLIVSASASVSTWSLDKSNLTALFLPKATNLLLCFFCGNAWYFLFEF